MHIGHGAKIRFGLNGILQPQHFLSFMQQSSYHERLTQALADIQNEVLAAKKVYTSDFVNQHEAYAVILEEVDELWTEIKKNQKVYDQEAQRKEAKQAAAMLVRLMVELL